jgi:Anti-sigma-K factor rskA
MDDDLEPGDRERLRRVHDLLVAAGPPPEMSPALAAATSDQPSTVVPLRRPTRRRLALAGILAAALAPAAFGAGFLLGDRGDAAAGEPAYVVEMAGGGARATIAVFGADEAGNFPMRITARGLEAGERYELWLLRDGQRVRLCGTFAGNEGRTVVDLNAPWPLKRFDGWVVTRQDGYQAVLTEVPQ